MKFVLKIHEELKEIEPCCRDPVELYYKYYKYESIIIILFVKWIFLNYYIY